MSTTLRLAHVTDLHLDDFLAEHYRIDARANVAAVLDHVAGQGISELVLGGDLGLPASQAWLFDAIAARHMRAMITLGNHDRLDDFRALEPFSSRMRPDGLYDSQSRNGTMCVFLDSSRGSIGEGQLAWFADQLKRSNGHLVVFVHHPILDCGGTTMDRLYPLANRDQVREALERAAVKASVFCGHYHTAHEQQVGGISQYVTPSTLMQIKRFAEPVELEGKQIGFRLIELQGDEVRTTVVSLP